MRNVVLGVVRGSVHTQTATLNVKLTFVGVWVKMPDVRIVAEMSKTQITMCIIIKRQNKKYFAITMQKLAI